MFGLIDALLGLYQLLILVNVLLSWVPTLDRSNPLIQFVYAVTEPVLEPLRRLIPPINGMIDVSPIVAIVACQLLRSIF